MDGLSARLGSTYYQDKLQTLSEMFPTSDVRLEADALVVGDKTYPIVDDVIILIDPEQYPQKVKDALNVRDQLQTGRKSHTDGNPFAEDIQYTFGAEWQRYNKVVPEYDTVFDDYFDIVDLENLRGKRVCDLGCGTGRWAKLLSQKTQLKEIICSDFSEAIFVARRNLKDVPNALFFMADLQRLPFKEDFCDFLYCLGVLLTLPTDQLDQVRALRKFAPQMLFYTYYSLDNRPFWWRGVFFLVNLLRLAVYRIRSPLFRDCLTWSIAAFVYHPLMVIGHLLRPFGLAKYVPLYEDHHHMNFRWWRLLAYDRFFCGIEKRVSRKEILTLDDTFSHVTVSPNSGYWHFLCER